MPTTLKAFTNIKTERAQQLVIGIVVAFTIVTLLRDRGKNTEMLSRNIVAGSVIGAVLTVLAIPAPVLAVGLAGVLGVGATFTGPGGTSLVGSITRTAGAGARGIFRTNNPALPPPPPPPPPGGGKKGLANTIRVQAPAPLLSLTATEQFLS